MFGKKKYSKEELDQIEQNLEQGNQLLIELSDKKEWVESSYDHIGKSRLQMEADIDRITEHIVSASEVAKNNSELSAKLCFDLENLKTQMESAETDYEKTVKLIGDNYAECQNLVEDNKHFTTPSKYLTELPNELRGYNTGYRESLSVMGEHSKQMGVLALNAAIEAGRMGEMGRQFVSAAEEIRNYAKNYEEAAKGLEQKLIASDEKIAELEEVIHHLVGLLKDSNMGMAHLMKEFGYLNKQVEGSAMQPFSKEVKEARELVVELKNGAEEIIKSEERNRIQMDDITEEIESQKKSEQEVLGELQKLFYATGLYVDRIQKGEES